MQIKFNKMNPEAQIPCKREGDIGYDLYALPQENRIIYPHETKKFHTGLRGIIDPGYAVIFKDRSSLGSKGLRVAAGVIDCSYRGEWIVAIVNENDESITLPEGKAVAQFVIIEEVCSEIKEINSDSFESDITERGEGGFGSSGK